MKGGSCYADFFPSTRQMIAAFGLYRKFSGCEHTEERLLSFLLCMQPHLDFLEFCAREEGKGSVQEYLDCTGCGIRIEDVPELYLEYQSKHRDSFKASNARAKTCAAKKKGKRK